MMTLRFLPWTEWWYYSLRWEAQEEKQIGGGADELSFEHVATYL